MSPNVAIISATIAVLTLVLAIFGASWLNQRSVEKLLEQFQRSNEKLFEQLQRSNEKLFEQFAQRFDARIDTVLSEIKRLDQRIDLLEQRLDQRIDSLDHRIDRIERQLEAIFKPTTPRT